MNPTHTICPPPRPHPNTSFDNKKQPKCLAPYKLVYWIQQQQVASAEASPQTFTSNTGFDIKNNQSAYLHTT